MRKKNSSWYRQPMGNHWRKIVLALAVMTISGGCARSPADLWVGEYDSFLLHDPWTCDGEELEDGSEPATIVLTQNGSDLLMNGRCPFPLRVLSATSAEFATYGCYRIISGQETHVRVIGGALSLDGVRLGGNLSLELTTPEGGCVRDEILITGDRL